MTATATPPTLVLLPGLDGTGKLFSAFVRELGSDLDTEIIAYPVDQPMGYEELEALVRARLPGDRRFVLLGESFSGPIAIRIAAEPPPELAGLILCGTFAKNPYPLLAWVRPLAAWFPVKSLPRWLRAPLMWGSNQAERAPSQLNRAMAGVSAAVVRRRIAALLAVDASAALARVRPPILVLQAGHDRVVPRSATLWIVGIAPRTQLIEIDGPHLLLQTRPSECAAAVLPFMRAAASYNMGICP